MSESKRKVFTGTQKVKVALEADKGTKTINEISQKYSVLKGALWSPSYFAGSCGGAPLAVIRQYIEQQQTPH